MNSKADALPPFLNQDLLITALTHRSALNEKLSTSSESYERLEFLGDAVLELSTTNFLYTTLPEEPEGTLTAFRSALVKTTMLAQVATELGLGERIYMSRGEESTGGRQNPSLLADCFEAVIGALYLDQGYDVVDGYLKKILFPKFEYIQEHGLHRDYKSSFQELVQSMGNPTPTYKVLADVGPDHDKVFTVGVFVADQEIAVATGTSKQRAEQASAKLALEKMQQK